MNRSHTDGWQIEGGEREGGPNVLPKWAVYTEQFPDTSGETGAGIVTYSKTTFAYVNAREPVARLMAAAPRLARYIVARYRGEKDGACRECYPLADIPPHIEGFRCAYHFAKALLSDEKSAKC